MTRIQQHDDFLTEHGDDPFVHNAVHHIDYQAMTAATEMRRIAEQLILTADRLEKFGALDGLYDSVMGSVYESMARRMTDLEVTRVALAQYMAVKAGGRKVVRDAHRPTNLPKVAVELTAGELEVFKTLMDGRSWEATWEKKVGRGLITRVELGLKDAVWLHDDLLLNTVSGSHEQSIRQKLKEAI